MNEERECLNEMKLRPNKRGRDSQFFYVYVHVQILFYDFGFTLQQLSALLVMA